MTSHKPVVAATPADAETIKVPFWGKVQTVFYSAGATQVAVGIVSAIYVIITQGVYFGKSFKWTWDHLNLLWHFAAIPLIGPWLSDEYDLARHIYLRDSPESILAFAFVAMIVVKWKNPGDDTLVDKLRAKLGMRPRDKTKIPLMDRILIALKMPSRYQAQAGRHPDTSGLQFLFLAPSMLLAAIPGEILMSVVIFGGMAIAHRLGYHSPWLTPESPWVPIAIGIAGGAFAGHKPAVKAGDTVQMYFLRKRLNVAYQAEKLLEEFRDGEVELAAARDELTRMRAATPGVLYPIVYQLRFKWLLAHHAAARRYSWWNTVVIIGFVTVLIILAVYGLYVRKWGVTHGFWKP